ncbi:MAG TPA: glycosyltransferase family 4 protein [Chthoniobacterales bacterium]
MSRPAFAYLLERFPAFTQTFVVREVLEMRRQGVDVPVVSLRRTGDGPEGHFPAKAHEGVTYLPDPEELVSGIKSRRTAGTLPKESNQRLANWGDEPDKMRLYEAIWAGEWLRKNKIRHVHVHFAGIAARTAFLIKELFGITFSVTGHAQDIFCATDFRIGLDALIRESKLIVTVTDFSARQLREKHPQAAGKIHRVYNGINIRAEAPEREPVTPPRILSVGRLIEKKGFDVLIEACGYLRDCGMKFECLIVGDGPLEQPLRTMIDEWNLVDSVRLAGPKSRAEIIELSLGAAVFALPCVRLADGDSDNLPTVITESMAFGLPVVSTRVAGIPEQIDHEKTGLIVPERDVEALAGAVSMLLQDPKKARAFGEAGFAKARADFSKEATVGELRRLLKPDPWWKRLFSVLLLCALTALQANP